MSPEVTNMRIGSPGNRRITTNTRMLTRSTTRLAWRIRRMMYAVISDRVDPPGRLLAQPGFLERADGARGPLVVAAVAHVRLECVHLVYVVHRDDGHVVDQGFGQLLAQFRIRC